MDRIRDNIFRGPGNVNSVTIVMGTSMAAVTGDSTGDIKVRLDVR